MYKNLPLKLSILISLAFSFNANADVTKQIEAMGAKVISITPSAAKGYNAILSEKNGKKRMFYGTEDGQYLIYGLIFDSNGNSITALDASKASKENNQAVITPPSVEQASNQHLETVEEVNNMAFKLAKESHSISEGKGRDVYVIFDPNCPYCKSIHDETRGYLGKSKIHWIPVGVLSQDSINKAGKIITANSAASIMKLSNDKGITEPATQAESDKISKNIAVMLAAKSNSVPTIIYKDNSGNVKVVSGKPPSNEIKTIFGGL